MLQQIRSEITQPFYQQNFPNDGTRFIAWYLRRVLRCDPATTKDNIMDGADDKQIDAVVVADDERRVLVVQGKFLDGTNIDGEPLREILAAWSRLNDLGSLQKDCNEKLRQKLEAVRQAIDDEYDIQFELLTTGEITDAAKDDLKAFSTRLEETNDLAATIQLVDTEVIQARLAEVDALELPSLNHSIVVESANTLVTTVNGAVTIVPVEILRRHQLRGGKHPARQGLLAVLLAKLNAFGDDELQILDPDEAERGTKIVFHMLVGRCGRAVAIPSPKRNDVLL